MGRKSALTEAVEASARNLETINGPSCYARSAKNTEPPSEEDKRKWWASLTDEEKAFFIELKQTFNAKLEGITWKTEKTSC